MAGAAAGRAMDVLDRRLAGPMRQVQAGDKRADAIVLRDCEPIVRRAARRIGGADERLEDVVQETLVTLHNA